MQYRWENNKEREWKTQILAMDLGLEKDNNDLVLKNAGIIHQGMLGNWREIASYNIMTQKFNNNC